MDSLPECVGGVLEEACPDGWFQYELLTPTVRASVGDETFLTGNGALKTTCYIFLNNIL